MARPNALRLLPLLGALAGCALATAPNSDGHAPADLARHRDAATAPRDLAVAVDVDESAPQPGIDLAAPPDDAA